MDARVSLARISSRRELFHLGKTNSTCHFAPTAHSTALRRVVIAPLECDRRQKNCFAFQYNPVEPKKSTDIFRINPLAATKGTKHIDRAHINQKTHIWRKKALRAMGKSGKKVRNEASERLSKRWTRIHNMLSFLWMGHMHLCTRLETGYQVSNAAKPDDGVPIIRQGQRIQNSIHWMGLDPSLLVWCQAQVKFERSSIYTLWKSRASLGFVHFTAEALLFRM